MTESAPQTEPDPRRWWALALLCGAFYMVILDAAIVTVALPSIKEELGFTTQGLQWVVSAYALTFAGLLLLGGRAADLLGRRRVFVRGTVASEVWAEEQAGDMRTARSACSCATRCGRPGSRRANAAPAWGADSVMPVSLQLADTLSTCYAQASSASESCFGRPGHAGAPRSGSGRVRPSSVPSYRR